MKTFIRWTGNKTKYKKHIIPLISFKYDTYIEPFLGGGSIFLSLCPKKWIINDINNDLMDIWHHIKENPDKLIKSLKSFNTSFAGKNLEEKHQYCQMMASKLNNSFQSKTKRITFFIMLKFSSYLGKIVQNNKFIFPGLDIKQKNVIKPIVLNSNYYTNIKNISYYLNTSVGKILQTDYKYICQMAKKNDFVFLDPPYIENHKYQFNYNISENLSQLFIEELYTEVQKLDKRNVKWIMTQANTKNIRDTFKEYDIFEMPVYRHTRKQYETELIILGHAIKNS